MDRPSQGVKYTPRIRPPDPEVWWWPRAVNSTLYNMFLAQLGRADDKDMEEFMAKYNLDPYGETSARRDGMGLGQSEMLASSDLGANGQASGLQKW